MSRPVPGRAGRGGPGGDRARPGTRGTAGDRGAEEYPRAGRRPARPALLSARAPRPAQCPRTLSGSVAEPRLVLRVAARLQLEGAVLHVEVIAEAALQLVQHLLVPERVEDLGADDHVRR